MNEHQTFRQIAFSPDFTSARRDDGTEISFTRAESRILRLMSRSPGRLLTRNQLLDAVSGEGSDKSDRNIDYTISRLRRKLGDGPKQPRFIATRYGEGYIWIHRTASDEPPDAEILVGPLRGLDGIGDLAPLARRFAEEFFDAVRSDLPNGGSAAFVPDPILSVGRPSPRQKQSIEFTFFTEANQLECILTARAAPSGSVLGVARNRLDTSPTRAGLRHTAAEVAHVLLGQIWRSVVATSLESPLPVAMHDAAGLPVGENASWKRNDLKLKRLLHADPEDPTLKLFYATHLHSKYILLGHDLFQSGKATCKADEDRIETLVLSALPHILQDPSTSIMAAKLLFFLDRGYDDLAVEMAEEGLRASTAIASSLAIVGQMRSFTGRTDEAIGCLEQAARLAAYGSEFQVYTLFMKCQALAAAGHWDELARTRKELYKVRPATVLFEPAFTDPFKPSFRARALSMALTRKRARALLMHFTYVSTRLFRKPQMRENSIRAPLRLFLGRFGDAVVPDSLRQIVPDLVDEVSGARR